MPGFWPCCPTPTGTSESAAVNVILLEPIGNLGSLGDEVSVKRASPATICCRKARPCRPRRKTAMPSRRGGRSWSRRPANGGRRPRIAASVCRKSSSPSPPRAAEEGRLYGSVGAREIAAALTAQGIEVHRSEVRLPDGVIRNIGDYQVAVQLHSDLTITIPISVIAE